MISAFTFVVLGVASPPSGRGFAPQSTKPPIKPASNNPPIASLSPFLEWAEKNGIKPLVPLKVTEFDGERGVGHTDEYIMAGANVLNVPSKLALRVHSLSQPPRWVDNDAWAACKWDARLAMLLLREENDAESNLKPWLAQLPTSLTTPALSPPLLAGLEKLNYPPLVTAVTKQRAEWDAARSRCPGNPSAEKWDWAMSVVRSRAFSGPYSGGTFIGALAQLFLASTAALLYALWFGGAGASDRAFDGFSFAVVFILSNEFVFGPRLTRAKQYVLCPWIDFLNHDGRLGCAPLACTPHTRRTSTHPHQPHH